MSASLLVPRDRICPTDGGREGGVRGDGGGGEEGGIGGDETGSQVGKN